MRDRQFDLEHTLETFTGRQHEISSSDPGLDGGCSTLLAAVAQGPVHLRVLERSPESLEQRLKAFILLPVQTLLLRDGLLRALGQVMAQSEEFRLPRRCCSPAFVVAGEGCAPGRVEVSLVISGISRALNCVIVLLLQRSR